MHLNDINAAQLRSFPAPAGDPTRKTQSHDLLGGMWDGVTVDRRYTR